ncbi:MAG: anti-sigma factor antagonist [Armatimonadota bacterium]|nr:anti-sigma factor antagonist [bacterium]
MGIISQLTLPEINQADNQDRLELRVTKDVSYENAHEVIDAVAASLENKPKEMVLDLSEVEMIDSSGLRALLQSQKLCDNAGARLKLASVSQAIARIIGMSGFAQVFGLPSVHIDTQDARTLRCVTEAPTGWKIYEHQATSEASVIALLRSRIMEAAENAGADSETLCDIQIAVGEALANAYRHGSPNKGVDKIKLRCMTCSRAIVVEISDEGKPFNPDSLGAPDPNKMRDHGMGVFLMRQAMDVVEFQMGCPGNKVRMIKWLHKG